MALWIPFKNYPAKWNAGRLRGLLRISGLEPAANRAIANTIGAVMADFAVAERENYLALERAVNAAGGRPPATVVVAASNATAVDKDNADYVCDGTADDEQINAAMGDLGSFNGTVLLTEGRFTTAAPVSVDSGATLAGQNRSSTQISANHTGDVIDGVSSAFIRDLQITKAGSTNPARGIDLRNSPNGKVERVDISNCDIGIHGDFTSSTDDESHALDCEITACPGNGIRDLKVIRGCRLANCGTTSGRGAIHSVLGWIVAHNYIIDNAAPLTDIGIVAPIDGVVVGNVVKNTNRGIECGPGSAGVDEAGLVMGNVIHSCTTGIYVDGSRWLLVGNSIFLPGTHGIDLDNSSAVDIMVLNNKIHDPGGDSANTYDGIHIQSADCTVQGNMCRNPSGNGRYGINITGVSSGAYVVNNDLRDAADWGTDALVDSGTGSIIADPGHATYGDNVT